jgi:uncharacterized protein (TIGR02646 family)
MRKFDRVEEPAFLRDKCDKWGEQWARRRSENPAAQFHWHAIGGIPVNQLLLPSLKAQTQDHCSFCDSFPVSPPSIDTIEHFRPKSAFPIEAYRWENLYFCCMYCQQKAELFDEGLIRPDADDYDFDDFFRWDFTKGTIEVNERASAANQLRARVTIAIYRLNEGHPKLRRLASRLREKATAHPLEDFPYRN